MSRSNQQKPVPPQDTSKILVDSNGPKVEKQPLLLVCTSFLCMQQHKNDRYLCYFYPEANSNYLCLRESSFLAFSSCKWWYRSLSLTNSSPQFGHRNIWPWCLDFICAIRSLWSRNFSLQIPQTCFLGFRKLPSIMYIIIYYAPEYLSKSKDFSIADFYEFR